MWKIQRIPEKNTEDTIDANALVLGKGKIAVY